MIYAKINVYGQIGSLTESGWISNVDSFASLLNSLEGRYNDYYAPNIYAAQARFAANLLGGKVTLVKKIRFTKGVVY